MAKQLFDVCYHNIQNLINVQLDETIGGQFHTDICTSLFQLRDNLLELQQQCSVAPTTSSVASKTIESNSTAEERQLNQIIQSTRITPRVKGLKDIAGLDDVKKVLTTIVILPILQPQLYTNEKICNSVLLYGPPGTGKTRLTHALAAEACACFFSVNSSDILSQYVGQNEKLVRALFKVVKEPRESATILFMDEIDGLCRCRTSNEVDWNRRLKSELMCQLSSFEDCRNVFLICSTNCPWDLDTAFVRRFQRRIYIPLPTRPDRFNLLQLLTKETPLQDTSVGWGPLLTRTEGYSGSDIADIVRNALTNPITELIDNALWKLNDNYFVPASNGDNIGEVIECNLLDLPPNTVQARPADESDLMVAANIVKRTVSDAEIMKYEEFVGKD